MRVTFQVEGGAALSPRAVAGVERLGESRRFVIEAVADQAIPCSELVGKAAVLGLGTELGDRLVHGLVTEVTVVASGMGQPQRRYRVVLESTMARLGHRRRCRVFQHMTAAQIIQQVAEEGGLGAVTTELAEELPERRYVTQYHETDRQFIRRLCEEDGFWWREDPGDEASAYVLADRPGGGPREAAVILADEAGLLASDRRAWGARKDRRRAAGRVFTRDYTFTTPAVRIEGEHTMGGAHEQAVGVYRAADRASDAATAKRRSQLHLESLRAQSAEVSFDTSALSIYPGVVVPLESGGAYSGMADAAGEVFVVAVRHAWEHGKAYRATVVATPLDLPFRLSRATPRPHIAGVQYAIVTGPDGEEVFVDDDGCVRVRFLWDRQGPTDDKSSLPVRVLQPNLEGSMLVPRIGWEVWVAFEDGDPDRPYVLGRAFNGKHRPPVALPVNKTMTSLSTSSSPGAGCQNFVRYEDGAGAQGLSWNAGFNMERHIGADMKTQTVGDDRTVIEGSQTVTVAGNQTESVTAGRIVDVDAQSINVGGLQTLSTPQAMDEKIGGTQALTVGGALLEAVGSPGDVALDLAVALLGSVGGLSSATAPIAGVLGPLYNWGKALAKGDAAAAEAEVKKFMISKMGPVGEVAELVNDVLSASSAADDKAGPREKKVKKEKPKPGERVNSNVGGAGASSASAPKASGSGNRIHKVGGSGLEAIGGALVIATPGASKCTTLGAAVCAVGGPSISCAGKVSTLAAGGSVHTTGLYKVTAGAMVREAISYTANTGAWSSTAGGKWAMMANSGITLTSAAMNIAGKLVIKVGGSTVVMDGSGMTITSPTITLDAPNKAKEVVRS